MIIIIPIVLIISVATYGYFTIRKMKRDIANLKKENEALALQIASAKEIQREVVVDEKKPKFKVYHHPQLGDFALEMKREQ